MKSEWKNVKMERKKERKKKRIKKENRGRVREIEREQLSILWLNHHLLFSKTVRDVYELKEKLCRLKKKKKPTPAADKWKS